MSSPPSSRSASPVMPTMDPAEAELMQAMMAPPTSTLSPGATLRSASGIITPLNTARTNATLQAQRHAIRLNLSSPYSRDLADFAQDNQCDRQLRMYGRLLSMEQALGRLTTPTGAYVVEKPLKDNIEAYAAATLLSPKLSRYKGAVIVDHAIVKHQKINLPSNLDRDTHIASVIKTAITDQLSQCRSDIKKKIKQSRDANQTIYDLASALVKDTNCSVTVVLCARIALLRAVHSEPGKSGSKFWDYVDTRLAFVRKMATQTPDPSDALQRAFTKYLDDDRAKYTSGSGFAATSQAGNHWQNTVDDILERSAVIQGSVPTEPAPTASGYGDIAANEHEGNE